MGKTKKMTVTALIAAATATTSSVVYIPAGFAKIFPVQHFANILSAVLLGPAYAATQAFISSLIRNLLGTGTIFAFPGSIIGAFLAAWLYKKTKKAGWAAFGEIFGTGILGAVACYPVAVLFLGREATLFGFVPAFILSSFAGAVSGYVLIKIMQKNKIWGGMFRENSTHHRWL